MQHIADAVGYSKPGLLHRFGSKEALYRAVLDEVKETVEVIVDHVVSLQEHPEQLEGVLELVDPMRSPARASSRWCSRRSRPSSTTRAPRRPRPRATG